MAHTKLSLGPERPLSAALERQNELMRELAQAGDVPMKRTKAEADPVWTEEKSAEVVIHDVVVRAKPISLPPIEEPAQGLDHWMRTQTAERVAIKGPAFSVTLSAVALHETDTHVHVAYDAKVVTFVLKRAEADTEPPDLSSNGTMQLELGWEDRLTLWFRDSQCRVIFANGLCTFPGWPFHIISFFKAQD
jgi:hypothetical protein